MTKSRAHLIVALLAITASLNYLPSRSLLGAVSPEALVALRFGVGALVVLFLFPKKTINLPLKNLAAGACTGMLFGLALIPLYLSLRTTHSGVTAFLVGTCAVFAPIFEYVALRRIPSRYQIIGLVVAIVGTAFLSFHGDLSLDAGSLWGLLSAVIFGLWSVAVSFFRQQVPSLDLGLGQIYGTALLFALIALGTSGIPFGALTSTMWLCLIYLGAVSVALRFLLQSHVQGFTTATNVEIIFLLEPLFAFLWAAIFAGEVATQLQIFGCILVTLGVLVAQKSERRPIVERHSVASGNIVKSNC